MLYEYRCEHCGFIRELHRKLAERALEVECEAKDAHINFTVCSTIEIGTDPKNLCEGCLQDVEDYWCPSCRIYCLKKIISAATVDPISSSSWRKGMAK